MNGINVLLCFLLMALGLFEIARSQAGESCLSSMSRLPVSANRNLPGRCADCFHSLSLQGALPVAIWLSSGWDGLILHWLGPWLVRFPSRAFEGAASWGMVSSQES